MDSSNRDQRPINRKHRRADKLSRYFLIASSQRYAQAAELPGCTVAVGDLSTHFSLHEFACPHCGVTKISGKLVNALERLHTIGPEPIMIHDGYRCPEHNKEVGGADHSEHMEGIAADIKIQGLTLQQQYDRAIQIPEFAEGGIGVYDGNFLHVDVRDGKARWSRKGGVYLGIDQLVNV